ncbi:MAG: hypothetical protein ACO4CG_06300 [Prochlorothrix sp.]|nr:hypothetical protein [Prochlorothrix sp.]
MELELVQALLFCGAVFLSSLILTPLLCWVLLKPGHAAPPGFQPPAHPISPPSPISTP